MVKNLLTMAKNDWDNEPELFNPLVLAGQPLWWALNFLEGYYLMFPAFKGHCGRLFITKAPYRALYLDDWHIGTSERALHHVLSTMVASRCQTCQRAFKQDDEPQNDRVTWFGNEGKCTAGIQWCGHLLLDLQFTHSMTHYTLTVHGYYRYIILWTELMKLWKLFFLCLLKRIPFISLQGLHTLDFYSQEIRHHDLTRI